MLRRRCGPRSSGCRRSWIDAAAEFRAEADLLLPDLDPQGRRAEGQGPGQVPEELQIEHEDGELRVDDGERLQIFYLDGQKHRREMGNGAKLETVATLLGRVITIEEKLDRGKIDRKMELSEDAESIVMTLNIKLGNMKEPVLIRTVYERVE